jgi:hypothetical protein
MAFQNPGFRDFHLFLQNQLLLSPDERALAENFLLEERLPSPRETQYGGPLAPPLDMDRWRPYHQKYMNAYVLIKKETRGLPEIFAPVNRANAWEGLDENQFLVRVESLAFLLNRAEIDTGINTHMTLVQQYLKNRTDPDLQGSVTDLLQKANQGRDLRPCFAGFWDEVKKFFADDPVNDDPDWPNKVRDCLGLGHYDFRDGEDIPILLMQYRVAEVKGRPPAAFFAAVPTVLDGGLFPFFCFTPLNLREGQAVDLSPGGAMEYTFYCEILHQYLDYRPEHIYRAGWITRPPGKTCAHARRIHLEFLKDDFKFFDEL